jgi:hypothetical protein
MRPVGIAAVARSRRHGVIDDLDQDVVDLVVNVNTAVNEGNPFIHTACVLEFEVFQAVMAQTATKTKHRGALTLACPASSETGKLEKIAGSASTKRPTLCSAGDREVNAAPIRSSMVVSNREGDGGLITMARRTNPHKNGRQVRARSSNRDQTKTPKIQSVDAAAVRESCLPVGLAS